LPATRGLGSRILAGLALSLLAATLWLALAPITVRGDGLGTLRLRVVANSNATRDQLVKDEVRDAVLAFLAPGMAQAKSLRSASRLARASLPQVQALSWAVLQYNDLPQERVTVQLGPVQFPAKRLADMRFPAGTYLALLVTLGRGQGHNWWTVLFPTATFLQSGGRLLIFGPPSTTTALTPAQRQTLLAWVAGRAEVHWDGDVLTVSTPEASVIVQLRFALWSLWRRWLR